MRNLINNLSIDEVIEFHTCCNKLMEHQITETGNDWVISLNENIGIEIIFKWSTFVGKVIGEDFRNHEFKIKARKLSNIIQTRFSEIGLDISLWPPVFFYLGMIYTFAKHIGFVKIHHTQTTTRLDVLSRIDKEFASSIRINDETGVLFVDSRKENPILVTEYLVQSGLLEITKLEFFVEDNRNFPDSFLSVDEVVIHRMRCSEHRENSNYIIKEYWPEINNSIPYNEENLEI